MPWKKTDENTYLITWREITQQQYQRCLRNGAHYVKDLKSYFIMVRKLQSSEALTFPQMQPGQN